MPVDLLATPPDRYGADLGDRGLDELHADRRVLAAHLERMAAARESAHPVQHVGAWKPLDLVRALDAIEEHIGQAQARESLDLFDQGPVAYRARSVPISHREQLEEDKQLLHAELDRLYRAAASRAPLPAVNGWTATEIVRSLARAAEQLETLSMEEGTPNDRVGYVREGGVHGHGIDAEGQIGHGGRHAHVFLRRGRLLMTERDGAHSHESGDETWTEEEDDHEHTAFVEVDGETVEITFGGATPHRHQKLTGQTTVDGLHQHTAEIDGQEFTTLLPDEFRALFGVATESLHLSAELAEEAGIGSIPTGKPFAEWWAAGRGPAGVRRLLAPFALGYCVQESTVTAPPARRFDEATPWLAVAGEDVQAFDDEASAIAAACATCQESAPQVTLFELDGDVYRPRKAYRLAEDDGRAVEALLARASESIGGAPEQMSVSGYVLRAAEADDRVWRAVAIEAGLSDNDNWWPRSLLQDKLMHVLESAAVQEIIFDPASYFGARRGPHRDHLPADVAVKLPPGMVPGVVGQFTDAEFQDDGGRVPKGTKLRAIMSATGLSEEEVLEESKGRIVGLVHLDSTTGGKDAHERFRSAEARGRLEDHGGLSIDSQYAPFLLAAVEGSPKPVIVRTDVDEKRNFALSIVSRPGAQGRVLRAA